MTARVILVEATPRQASDGATVTVRLAGGGEKVPYEYGGNLDWRAGVIGKPTLIASLEFAGGEFPPGSVPAAAELEWQGRDLAELAGLVWRDAPITVRMGPEGAALPPVVLSGQVLEAVTTREGRLKISLSDPAAALRKPLAPGRFAGTGGLEGPVEWDGRVRTRVWGRVWNLAGEPIDKANNIYCFADPLRQIQAIDAVRDKGAAAAALSSLAWQGSAAATFAALQASVPPQGGGVVCPSLACVKWWTQPAGDLCADLRGETAGGYVETTAQVIQRLVSAIGGPALAATELASTIAARPAPIGWVVRDEQTTVAAMLDELTGNSSLMWLINSAGEIVLRPWAWGASVASVQSHEVARLKTLRPVATRKIGYQRNELPMKRGDLAAIVLAEGVEYADGTPIEDLRPAEIGATDGAQTGVNLVNGAGTAVLTDPQIVTAQGTAAAITNQGMLATQNNVNLGTQVTGALGTANAAAGLVNANISIAPNGALTGGGGGQVTIGGLGYTGALNATFGARAGTNIYRTDGTTVMSQAEIRTAEGVASAITGQGTFATKSTLANSDIGTAVITLDKVVTANGNLIANGDFNTGDFRGWRQWTNAGSQSVVLNSTAGVPAGAPSRYVARLAYSGTASNVSLFAASKAYNDTGAENDGFLVIPGESYRVRLMAAKSAGYAASALRVHAYFYKSDGTWGTYAAAINGITPATLTTSFADYLGTFVAPAGAQRCWLYIVSEQQTAGEVYIAELWADRVSGQNDLTSNAVRLGTNIVRADGSTSVNEALVVTAQGTAAAISGQGPGATAPAAQVMNFRDDGNTGFVAKPEGGLLNINLSNQTGAIKIALPLGWTNTMIRFQVDIYNYATGGVQTYHLGGYTYSGTGTGGYWVNQFATYIGPRNWALPVRFGHDGVTCCVWIGEPTTVWQHPKVHVVNVHSSFSASWASANWRTGWTLSLSTDPATNVGGNGSLATITAPRAGDAVFGEGIQETAGGTVATLANFKTSSGTAAAIAGQGALATLSAATWASHISGRPAELTDGRITVALRADGSMQGDLYTGTGKTTLTSLLEAGLRGKSLAVDPDFSRGVNPLTLYGGAGAVAMTVVDDLTAPNGSGKVVRVSYNGSGTANPGYGGFSFMLVDAGVAGLSRPGCYARGTTLLYVIRAKIPAGRGLSFTTNPTGDGNVAAWLTSQLGTGNYETYIYRRTIGTTGSFQSTGYFYITSGADVAFDWDVAYADVRELGTADLPQVARLITSTGSITTDAMLITGQGTAAAIAGQGSLATKNTVDLATSDVANKSLANLDSTANTKLSGIETGATLGGTFGTNLRETAGGTIATLAAFKTSSGTAAAIAGQGSLATKNAANWATEITGTGKPEDGATFSDNRVRNSTLASSTVDNWAGAARTAGVAANNDPAFYCRSATGQGNGGYINGGTNTPCVGGETLFCSALARDATPATNNFVRFNPFFFKADGSFLSQSVIDLQINSSTWALRKTAFTVPQGAAFFTLLMQVWCNTGASADMAVPRVSATENAATVGARLGTNLQNSAATVVLGDADVITASGVAASIAGQGSLATKNSATWSSDITGTGKPQDNADVTALAQVSVFLTTDQTIPATYNGTVTSEDLANIVWAPVVTRGGSSIRTANGTTYALTNASGGTFAVDNTNGSASKGNVTISAMSSNIAQVELTITVDGVAQPKLLLKVTKNLGAPPPLSGGSTPKTVTWGSGEFAALNTTSYTPVVTAAKTVALASGESLYGTAPLTYTVSQGGGVTRTMSYKWQYSVPGANSWNDFASPITGTPATAFYAGTPPEYNDSSPGTPGSASVTQTKSGLAAGNWEVRLVGVCSATGRTVITSGTASVEAKV